MESDRGQALRQATLACRKGGTLSILGVYGLMDKFPSATRWIFICSVALVCGTNVYCLSVLTPNMPPTRVAENQVSRDPTGNEPKLTPASDARVPASLVTS